jgi:hypothetical protein
MISVNVKVNRNLLTPALKKIRSQIEQLPQRLEEKMIELTPEDTGNAKSKTRLVNNKRIEAKYPYAKVLDKGRHMTNKGRRGSNQAPRGMTGPLKEWYRKVVRSILRTRR